MDSFKLINDFLTFNGRLEKKPFIRRYLIVFLLTYALITIGRAINMPLLVAASSAFVIPQMSLAVRRCHDIGLSWAKTVLVLIGLIIPLVSLFPSFSSAGAKATLTATSSADLKFKIIAVNAQNRACLLAVPGFIFQLIILFVLVCLGLVLRRLRRNNSNI